LFVVYADRCGSEGDLNYLGLSTIAGPDGKILAQAGNSESLLIADLDFTARERARRLFNYLGERRPELYWQ
jgi:predicted amidohydrolase